MATSGAIILVTGMGEATRRLDDEHRNSRVLRDSLDTISPRHPHGCSTNAKTIKTHHSLNWLGVRRAACHSLATFLSAFGFARASPTIITISSSRDFRHGPIERNFPMTTTLSKTDERALGHGTSHDFAVTCMTCRRNGAKAKTLPRRQHVAH